MSTSNVKVEMEVVTPETAQSWLLNNSLPYQRGLRKANVEFYASEMLRGDWDPTTVISFARVNGEEWSLVDGQHRLEAVVKAGMPQPFVIKRVTYKSADDIANAYARIDQGSKRTPMDQAHAWGLADKYGLYPDWTGKFMSGIKFIIGRFGWQRHIRPHPSDVVSMMDQYSGAMLGYYDLCGGADRHMRKALQRASTVAVGLVTLQSSVKVYGEEKVNEFWTGAVLDDGLRRGDARKTAHEHLVSTSMAHGAGSGSKTSYVSATYSSRWLASCFNAWVEDRSLQHAKPDPSRPILILGSPFNGK
ncbi:MAG: hypothetical protein IPM41_06480 [Sphingomonadales bacterium]|nr:hypothetical protein [Sphingomonadales bacterium]